MNNNMQELNLDEMEMVNGGFDWRKSVLGGFFGSMGGAAVGGLAMLAGGPIGIGVLAGALIVGGGAAAIAGVCGDD